MAYTLNEKIDLLAACGITGAGVGCSLVEALAGNLNDEEINLLLAISEVQEARLLGQSAEPDPTLLIGGSSGDPISPDLLAKMFNQIDPWPPLPTSYSLLTSTANGSLLSGIVDKPGGSANVVDFSSWKRERQNVDT